MNVKSEIRPKFDKNSGNLTEQADFLKLRLRKSHQDIFITRLQIIIGIVMVL
jgi:hypothetical protein